MCLFIDETHHPARSQRRYVRTLQRPVITIKGLRVDKQYDGTTKFIAPYRQTEYVLGKEYVAKDMRLHVMDWQDIDPGLHSLVRLDVFPSYFGTKRGMSSINDRSNTRFSDDEIYPFPAVIPAGAKVWVGWNNDLASDKLTVYRDMQAIHDAYGSIDAPTRIGVATTPVK